MIRQLRAPGRNFLAFWRGAKTPLMRTDMDFALEKRSQPRMEVDQAVYVTVLDEENPDGSKTSKADANFVGRITNYSSRGMGLIIGGPIPLGAAVAWNGATLCCSARYATATAGQKVSPLASTWNTPSTTLWKWPIWRGV